MKKKVLLLTMALSILVIGCDKKNSVSESDINAAIDDLSKNTEKDKDKDTPPGTDPKDDTDKDATSTLRAQCNEAAGEKYKLKLMTTKDSSTGKENKSVKLVKFNEVPASFIDNKEIIGFYRWKVDPNNTVSVINELLNYSIIDSKADKVIVNSARLIRWKELSAFAKKWGIDKTELFNRIIFKVKLNDPKNESQGFQSTIWDPKYKVIDNIALLIPSFAASPIDFAKDEAGNFKPDFLRYYHPFAKLVDYSYSDDQFKEMSDQSCF